MESIFYIALSIAFVASALVNWYLLKIISDKNVLLEVSHDQYESLKETVDEYTKETEMFKYNFIVKTSQQLDVLPDLIREDIHRCLLAKESLEAAKPIKPNNWDSVKEAFKGPVRIDERVRTI